MISRSVPVIGCLAWLSTAGLSETTETAKLQRYAHSHLQMGTKFDLIVYAHSAEEADLAFVKATKRLGALDSSMSDYKRESEVSRLSRSSGQGAWRTVTPPLWHVLEASQRLSTLTNGAFDITVGPLTKQWRITKRTNKLPLADTLNQALTATGYENLELDPDRRRVRLIRPGMRLDLGAIAKGFAVDEALKAIQSTGITTALVNGGGDLRAAGTPPHAAGWKLAILSQKAQQAPLNEVLLTNVAMATSGDRFKSLEIDGRIYSHLIDPQTGLGLPFRRTVTVLAPEGMLADALASALSVMKPEDAKALMREHFPEAAALIITQTANSADDIKIIGQADHRFTRALVSAL